MENLTDIIEENSINVSTNSEDLSQENIGKLSLRTNHGPLIPFIGINYFNNEIYINYLYQFGKKGSMKFEDFIENSKLNSLELAICSNCNEKQISTENLFSFCFECKKYFCSKCLNDNKIHNHKKYLNSILIDHTCYEHKRDFVGFCLSCLCNICTDCDLNDLHLLHKKIFYSKFLISENKIFSFREKIKEAQKFLNEIEILKKYILRKVKDEKMKEIVLDCYSNFKEKNYKLLNFVYDLISIYENNKNNLNYEIIKNTKENINFKNLKEIPSFSKLTDFLHYLNSFIILNPYEINFQPEIDYYNSNYATKDPNENINELIPNFNSNPHDLQFYDNIIENAFTDVVSLDNQFTLFKSFYDNYIVAYFYNNMNEKDYSIVCYDFINKKNINEFKHAHNKRILCIRHYFLNEKDVLITSSYDNSIKLWNVYEKEKILSIENAHDNIHFYNYFRVNSVCLIVQKNKENDNKNNMKKIKNINDEFNIVSSCVEDPYLKIWNSKGKLINKFICNDVYYVDWIHDNRKDVSFIICGSNKKSFSFNLLTNSLYKIYKKEKNESNHESLLVTEINKILCLIESSFNGFVNIFHFHKGSLLKEIYLGNISIRGMCLWNENYLLVSGSDYIHLLDIKEKKKTDKKFSEFQFTASCIMKIKIETNDKKCVLNECLFAHGNSGFIKVWNNEKKINDNDDNDNNDLNDKN